jgi:uncharacterized membrane protein YeaQ/YmgE (transglycosylase-associated protein family)
MKLITFILWLSVGASIGWIAGWMAEAQHRRIVMPVVSVEE